MSCIDRMPVLFLAHGTPMNALERNRFTEDWCKLNEATPRPQAIVCISAHWETQGTRVTCGATPQTIHDFGGFPPDLFAQQYVCPGADDLGVELCNSGLGIDLDAHWGLDHGAWSLLKHLYPQADIPVLQLSLDVDKTPAQHFALAQQLHGWRERGVLFIGSGNIVHNIHKWMMQPHGPFDWAREFDRKVFAAITAGDFAALVNYSQWQPWAADAVPTPEHFLPLLYALGLSEAGEALVSSNFTGETIEDYSMRSLRFG